MSEFQGTTETLLEAHRRCVEELKQARTEVAELTKQRDALAIAANFDIKGGYTVLSSILADRDRAEAQAEALTEKLGPNCCGCSYDRKGDVCMVHSPMLKQAEAERDDLQRLFDLQWTRSKEADAMWRAAHPESKVDIPDLGDLLAWLMEQAGKAADYRLERTLARADNEVLRGIIAESDLPCLYCKLPKAEMNKCRSGFPGCGRADDLLMGHDGSDHFYVENFKDFKGWGPTAKQEKKESSPDADVGADAD